MKIDLELWEINTALNALAKLPYEEVGGVIHRIKEQVDPDVVHCKDCVWFADLEGYPEAAAFRKKLHELFDGVLTPREGEHGICRKVTFCKERPVITNENGYCHRFEEKEETV